MPAVGTAPINDSGWNRSNHSGWNRSNDSGWNRSNDSGWNRWNDSGWNRYNAYNMKEVEPRKHAIFFSGWL